MKKAGATFLILILLLTVTTGCWNRRELNELAIQMGTAIDKVGDQYQISIQVVIPGEMLARTGSGRSPVTMYKATAPTVFEAFRKLTETSPRKIYSGHIRVLILGESVAREGISSTLDLLYRNPEARTDFYIMVARQVPAEDVLKILTPLEKIPAHSLFYSLDTSAKAWSPTTTVTMDQLVDQLVTEGLNPVLSGVRVLGNQKEGEKKKNTEEIEPSAILRYAGLAVFYKDRMIGWLSEEEGRGYNYIMNNVTSSVGNLECPNGGKLVLETVSSKTDIKGSVVSGKPVITIKVLNVSSIGEAECQIDLTDPQTINELQKVNEQHLTELMQTTVAHVRQKFDVDIFGFGHAIYRADPKAWERMKDDWNTYFENLEIKYDVEVIIRRIGITNNPVKNDLKE